MVSPLPPPILLHVSNTATNEGIGQFVELVAKTLNQTSGVLGGYHKVGAPKNTLRRTVTPSALSRAALILHSVIGSLFFTDLTTC